MTKSPALLSYVRLLTSFLFSMCFYHCLRILASEHMSKSKGAATPNLPSYSTKLVRRGSMASGRKHCKTKLLRKLPSKSADLWFSLAVLSVSCSLLRQFWCVQVACVLACLGGVQV